LFKHGEADKVQIQSHGKSIHVGVYDGLQEAKTAYLVAAEKHHGVFAKAA
jgi:hypothetical protein